jgi:hypothetical protein
MGRNSNPNAGPLLAWLRDAEIRARISSLHRKPMRDNRSMIDSEPGWGSGQWS